MVAGLRITNPDGAAQLDDRFQNFVLIQKGQVTLGANWTAINTTGGPYANFSVPDYYGYPPLVVLVNAANVFVRDAVPDGAGNWIFGMAGPHASASGTVVEYYVFGPPHSGMPRDPYGMNVRRANGTLSYHSGWKPLRVVAQIGNAASGLPASWTGVGGRKYGVGHVIDQYAQSAPIPAGTWLVNGTGTYHKTVGAVTDVSSGQIYQTVWGIFPPFPTEYSQPIARHLVVDLTNY